MAPRSPRPKSIGSRRGRAARPSKLAKLGKRGRCLTGALIATGAVAFAVAATPTPSDTASRLTAAAQSFLASLDAGQRKDVEYDFDDSERFDLRLAPIGLDGIALSDLDAEQRARARDLRAAALSEQGLRKVELIMSLENEVRQLEGERLIGLFTRFIRDPERYFTTIYGEPSTSEPWGFRFDGHHVSLNFTVVPGAPPASTPLFLGAQPRQVRQGWERAGLRVLAAEEDLARELYLSFDEAQRARATLPYESDRELFLGDVRFIDLSEPPKGLPRSEMNDEQKRLLDALLDVYIDNFPADVAAARRAEIDPAGRDAIHFAWAGSTEPGRGCYYRLQGPTLLLEFDDTVPGNDHIHTLWRDPRRDFGRDLLAEHRARAH